jgi:copper chaperone
MKGPSELEYTIDRMSCNSCKLLVTEELEEIKGVESIEVELASKRVVVRGNELDDAAIRSTLSEVGYEATPA